MAILSRETAFKRFKINKPAVIQILKGRVPFERASDLVDEISHWLRSDGTSRAMEATTSALAGSLQELQLFHDALLEYLGVEGASSSELREAILTWMDAKVLEFVHRSQGTPGIYRKKNFYAYVSKGPGDLLGNDWLKGVHPGDRQSTVDSWERSLKTGEFYSCEHRLRSQDGSYRWHLSQGFPLRNDAGEIIKWFGTGTDIHDQKTAMNELQEEKNRREQLITALSHDLRGPLTIARIGAELLMEHAGRTDLLQTLGPKIIESVQRANQMIEDLLDASRLRVGKAIALRFVRCDLVQIARQAIAELALIHGDRFILNCGGALAGYWSADGLRRVIENLCSNAVKYGMPDRPIIIELSRQGRWCRLSVHNEGPPLAPEELSGLFHEFQRSESVFKSGTKGWGLGLTIVRGIIQAHGGKVWVESVDEKGTTFFVEIPTQPPGISSLSEPKPS